MHGMMSELIQEPEEKKVQELLDKIKRYEDITDKLEIEIADYLRSVSQGEMSEGTSIRIRSMLSIINDLERIGDIYYQMSKGVERKMEQKIYFTPEQRNNILAMMGKLENAIEIMLRNLNDDYSEVSIETASDAEKEINTFRNELRKDHFKAIESKKYHIRSGMTYSDIYSSCEKIGDHIINVTEAITGEYSLITLYFSWLYFVYRQVLFNFYTLSSLRKDLLGHQVFSLGR